MLGLSWASFALGLLIVLSMIGRDDAARPMLLRLYDWLPAGQFQLSAGMLVDQLSMAFVLLITFVGSLIHVY